MGADRHACSVGVQTGMHALTQNWHFVKEPPCEHMMPHTFLILPSSHQQLWPPCAPPLFRGRWYLQKPSPQRLQLPVAPVAPPHDQAPVHVAGATSDLHGGISEWHMWERMV